MKPTNIALRAVLSDGSTVNSSNCEERADFVSLHNNVKITEYDDESNVIVKTEKGTYTVPRHATINAYIGVCGSYKVRVCLKKMVGRLSYYQR